MNEVIQIIETVVNLILVVVIYATAIEPMSKFVGRAYGACAEPLFVYFMLMVTGVTLCT